MKHTSVKLDSPCEFINITPINPLISKCQIKVCYVSDQPNRNRSIITKDVAREMANSLPGCPIMGFYNENNGDFEEHNRVIEISNGQFKIKDTTIPYGFVDMNAKVWFQKFIDDGINEREYLMTEGYVWTGQFPEAQRIIDQGNNQSMELDEKTLNASWTKDDNGKPQFFIINEAIISKLCILGEEYEPCFEGSTITDVKFSFEDDFKIKMFSMMEELKELIKEGGVNQMDYTRYAVEIGEHLWNLIYKFIEANYPDADNTYYSVYRIEGVFEDKGQKFVVLQNRTNLKYFRLNFALEDGAGFIPSDTLIEVTKSYVPAIEPQFSFNEVEEFEKKYAENKMSQDKNGESNIEKPEDNTGNEGLEESNPTDPEPVDDSTVETKYNLEEVVEYAELSNKYEELETKFYALESENQQLKEQLQPLIEFKNSVDKKEKQNMIDSFYMLSDEDKADVIANIDTYSVDDIEAKLSIICVRNKVSFSIEEPVIQTSTEPTTFNLNSVEEDDSATPAWVRAALETHQKRNN